jgi:hypothetical protein
VSERPQGQPAEGEQSHGTGATGSDGGFSVSYPRMTAAERKAPMSWLEPEADTSPCVRCQHPVAVTRGLEVQDGRVLLAFVTLSVICDECWLKEPSR